MTERDLYEQNIPIIAALVVECRKLSKIDYENFKNTIVKEAPETVKVFVGKVFIIIDAMLVKESIRV